MFYYWVCLEKSRTLIQCPYVSPTKDLLQKQVERFREFDRKIKTSELYHHSGHRTFHGGRGYCRRQFAKKDTVASGAAIKQWRSRVAEGLEHPEEETEEKRGYYPWFLPAFHLCRQNWQRYSSFWGLRLILNRQTRLVKSKYWWRALRFLWSKCARSHFGKMYFGEMCTAVSRLPRDKIAKSD